MKEQEDNEAKKETRITKKREEMKNEEKEDGRWRRKRKTPGDKAR